MTGSKIKEVVEMYQLKLVELGVESTDFDHATLSPSSEAALNHCLGMLPKMIDFVDEGRIEKAFRWLGFIQGVLWDRGIYTLDALMNHNRPAE